MSLILSGLIYNLKLVQLNKSMNIQSSQFTRLSQDFIDSIDNETMSLSLPSGYNILSTRSSIRSKYNDWKKISM